MQIWNFLYMFVNIQKQWCPKNCPRGKSPRMIAPWMIAPWIVAPPGKLTPRKIPPRIIALRTAAPRWLLLDNYPQNNFPLESAAKENCLSDDLLPT